LKSAKSSKRFGAFTFLAALLWFFVGGDASAQIRSGVTQLSVIDTSEGAALCVSAGC
jgi:hypothetical protein